MKTSLCIPVVMRTVCNSSRLSRGQGCLPTIWRHGDTNSPVPGTHPRAHASPWDHAPPRDHVHPPWTERQDCENITFRYFVADGNICIHLAPTLYFLQSLSDSFFKVRLKELGIKNKRERIDWQTSTHKNCMLPTAGSGAVHSTTSGELSVHMFAEASVWVNPF